MALRAAEGFAAASFTGDGVAPVSFLMDCTDDDEKAAEDERGAVASFFVSDELDLSDTEESATSAEVRTGAEGAALSAFFSNFSFSRRSFSAAAASTSAPLGAFRFPRAVCDPARAVPVALSAASPS